LFLSIKKKHHGSVEQIDSYPWDDLYQLVVGEYGIPPSEYWKMTPSEIGIIVESKRPKTVGKVSEDDYDHLMDRRAELEAQGIKVL